MDDPINEVFELLKQARAERDHYIAALNQVAEERDEARAVAREYRGVADFPRHAQFTRDDELLAAYPWLVDNN